MNPSIHQCTRTLIGAAVRTVALVSSTALASAVPGTAGAQLTACNLVDSADVVSLFGRSGQAKVNPVNGDCTWGSVGIGRRGLTLSISMPDTAITNAGYSRGRELAANNAPVTDVPQIGDHAYGVVVAYGATITVLTRGQIVQLRYANGVPGSSADLDRLRPVATNVVTRLRSTAGPATPIFTGRPK